ncbi:DMT family transporter [uncultured Duncaniella sp.]|uniref:DMT family transporter n=1 Tax=uncultured Duncaniella sp. TaxID=2768039 RepID=UPI0027310E5F|nr:EamA family transporter [uncultured Duncaniella sp.]
MKRSSNFIPHLFASISVIVWGVTFVSTKVLIGQGLTPLQIFVYRFALAYVCMLPLMRRLWANSLKDEVCLALGGLSGGSLYFLTENTALGITFASNVSLLICTAPIFTIILDRIIWKTPLRKSLLVGSLIALVGVAVVIINGNLEFKISPFGDFLTIVAAILWAIYSIIVRKLSRTYDTFFISRKVFFYGVVSVLPLFIASTSPAELSLLGRSAVWSNIMFLGIMTSMLCYMMWNVSVKALGADKASNYIYVNPLVTIIASAIFLGEPLTVFTFIGAAAIIGGVFIAERCG